MNYEDNFHNNNLKRKIHLGLTVRYYALLCMVVIYPLIVVPQLGFSIPRYILLALVSLFGFFFVVKDRLKINHISFAALAFFFVFSLIATILAPDQIIAWIGSQYRMTGFTTFVFSSILLVIASHCYRIEKILLYMITSASLVSFVALLQHFGLNIVSEGYSSTPYGTIGNSNWLGTYLVLILPGAILLFLKNNKKALLALTGFIYAGILVSVTRGIWLAFLLAFVAIVFYVFFYAERSKKISMVLVILVLFIITSLLLPTNDGIIFKRALSIPDQMVSALQYDDTAGSGRVFIWKETIKLIKENWAFGVGPDHLQVKIKNGMIMDKAHSIYLEIAVTKGVFALLSYLFFLSFFLRLHYCKDELGFLFFIMISTYLFQGLFNNDVIMVLPIFWITLGLSLSNMKRIDGEKLKNADR